MRVQDDDQREIGKSLVGACVRQCLALAASGLLEQQDGCGLLAHPRRRRGPQNPTAIGEYYNNVNLL